MTMSITINNYSPMNMEQSDDILFAPSKFSQHKHEGLSRSSMNLPSLSTSKKSLYTRKTSSSSLLHNVALKDFFSEVAPKRFEESSGLQVRTQRRSLISTDSSNQDNLSLLSNSKTKTEYKESFENILDEVEELLGLVG